MASGFEVIDKLSEEGERLNQEAKDSAPAEALALVNRALAVIKKARDQLDAIIKVLDNKYSWN